MKLSFMTWLCPDWDIKTILTAAEKYGYDGVEIRVESKQKHDIELSMGKTGRKEVRDRFSSAGIEISCVATSLKFAVADKQQREKNVTALKKYVDLCSDIGCPYIRIFGGTTPPIEIRGVINYMVESLVKVADYALGTDVEILLETHDDFSHSNRVAMVLREAGHRKLNALWDVMHPYRQLETFDEAYLHLRQYVRHLHIHDGKYNNDESKIDVCFLGEGVIDHHPAIKLLHQDRFRGHFSVEIIGKGEPDKWLSQYASKFRKLEKNLL